MITRHKSAWSFNVVKTQSILNPSQLLIIPIRALI